MSQFKLLAVRPLSNCQSKYHKVLSKGEIFKLYQDYEFLNKEGSPVSEVEEVYSIRQTRENGLRLYDKGKLQISVSAIVGNNGSGKSTLLELLYMAVYCLGTQLKFVDNKDEIKPLLNNFSQLLQEERIRINKRIAVDNERLIKQEENLANLIEVFGNDIYHEHIRPAVYSSMNLQSEITELNQRREDLDRLIKKEQLAHEQLLKEFRVCIFYQLGGDFFELRVDLPSQDGKILAPREIESFDVFSKSDMDLVSLGRKELNKSFFYTIVMNHSHYSLNSGVLGNWISTLFHKNDGYKTPIVINPMRTEGDFKINHETRLAKQRLFVNALTHKAFHPENEYLITQALELKEIQFAFNPNKVKSERIRVENDSFVTSGKRISEQVLFELINRRGKDIQLRLARSYHWTLLPVMDYAAQKLEKVFSSYGEYNFEEWTDDEVERVKLLANRIEEDESHVTNKIHQSINFLINNLEKGEFWALLDERGRCKTRDILTWMDRDKHSDLSRYIPPPIFDIKFILGEKDKEIDYEEIALESLSSGEQQFIHSIQAVLYHLVNLNSIHHSSVDRLRYKHVNIIFDEIELYFHPDLQRTFISELLSGIENLNLLSGDQKGIESINILFSTHSPFILSDIPASNILHLRYNSKTKRSSSKRHGGQTFGANIHDLLANDFFLQSGFMGEFAKEKISSLIEYLDSDSARIKPKEWSIESAEEFIQIIGEPYLKSDLLNLLKAKKSNLKIDKMDKREIDAEIKRLTKKRNQFK